VYLCYGIHALLNVITGEAGVPHGVLIRAIHPTHGLDIMMQRRKKKKLDALLTNGPGSLTAALGVTVAYTGTPLDSESLWISDLGNEPPQFDITPRIGIDYAEECIHLPYRFVVRIAK
jgi:DNA-3-methyladenine glycosylase